MGADPVPVKGFVPYVLVDGAADAIDFYVKAFDAEELYRLPMPDGKIGHAELKFPDGAVLYCADAPEDMPGEVKSPKALGGTTVYLHRYVPDVDAAVAQAEAAGATVLRPPEDQFYGDRSAVLQDGWGHAWSLHTHIRDVSPDEMNAAMQKMAGDS